MNNELTNHMDDLLVKYLLGETTVAETAEAEDWISLSEQNRRYFDELKLIWEKSLPETGNLNIDENKAWEKLQQKISHKPVIRKINSSTNYRSLLRIAAMFIAVLTVGFIIYRAANRNVTMLTMNAINAPVTDTLPDRSSVVLNNNSSLTYPEKFSGKTREVNLKGEAFFHVTPDKKQPFIIHTEQLSIRVVGTSFNVKEFNSDSAQVIVETGIVKVYSGNDTVMLTKGESVVYNTQTRMFRKSSVTGKYYDYYYTKTLIFDNTELSEVVNVLNNIFKSKILISKERTKSCRLTATFKNESLETIIQILQQTFGLTVTNKDGHIYLNGNGCN